MTRQLLPLCFAIVIAASGLAAPAAAATDAEKANKAADAYNAAAYMYARKEYEMAADAFREFLQAYPKHEKANLARLTLGRALIHQKKYDEAAGVLRDLRDKHGDFDKMAEVLFELGRAELARDKAAEAAEAFGRLVEKHGDHYLANWARARRARLLMQMDKHAEAADTLDDMVERFRTGANAEKRLEEEKKRLAKIHPGTARALEGMLERAHLTLGIAQAAAGKHADAVETLRKFLALSGDSDYAPTARFNLAQSLYHLEKFDEAAEAYGKIEDGPSAADAAFERGLALYRAEKYKPAAEAFGRVTDKFKKSPRAPKARLYAGMCLYLAKNYDAAVDTLSEAKSAEALYWLGKAHLKRDKAAEAVEALDKALKADPPEDRRGDIMLAKADALRALKKLDEAADLYGKFAEAFSDHDDLPRALYAAAVSLHQGGKYEASDQVAGSFIDQVDAGHELMPNVLFVSGENRFLQEKYDAAAERYGRLIEKHEKADDVGAARYRLAWIHYFQEDYDKAVAAAAKAAEVKGADFAADARYLVGLARFEKGDHEGAGKAFEAYLEKKDAETYRDDALLKLALARKSLDKAADAAKALRTLLEKHDKSELRPRAYYELAEIERKDEKYKDAAEHYKTVAEKHKEHDYAPYALFGLGLCRAKMENFDDAASAFGAVVERFGESELVPQALYRKGLALRKAGKHAEAVEPLKTVATKHGSHELAAPARMAWGLALQSTGKHEEAAAVFDALAEAADDKDLKRQAMYEKAWSLQEAGKADASLEAYDELAKAFPESDLAADAYFHLAEVQYKKKNYKEAVDLYERARASADERLLDKIRYRLGWCHWALATDESYAEAAKMFDRLVENSPDSDLAPEALLQAGEAYLKLGKPADAADRLKKLTSDETYKEFKDMADALFRLGEAQLALTRDAEARSTYTRLIKNHETYDRRAEAELNLGRALYRLDKFDEARVHLVKARDMTQTEVGARAAWTIGETYLEEKKPREAVKAFFNVEANWGGYTKWAAAAIHERGKAYIQLQRNDRAREAFQEVVKKYPDSKYAESAKDYLKKLG